MNILRRPGVLGAQNCALCSVAKEEVSIVWGNEVIRNEIFIPHEYKRNRLSLVIRLFFFNQSGIIAHFFSWPCREFLV